MYFRFAVALILIILISVAGIGVEKRCLALRRTVSRQRFRYEALCELSTRLRLKTQQLGAPARLYAELKSRPQDLDFPERPREAASGSTSNPTFSGSPGGPLIAARRAGQADDR